MIVILHRDLTFGAIRTKIKQVSRYARSMRVKPEERGRLRNYIKLKTH